MKSDLVFAIALFGMLLVIALCLLWYEFSKSPEKKAEEQKKNRQRYEKYRQEEARRQQEKQDNAYAKGCLQSSLETGCACVFFAVAVIFLVLVIVAS